MIQLDSGNVLLKPSHRKRLLASLKRSLKIGERIGHFFLNIKMHRVGRAIEIHATVKDRAGELVLRARKADWQSAFRELLRNLASQLHLQQMQLAVAR